MLATKIGGGGVPSSYLDSILLLVLAVVYVQQEHVILVRVHVEALAS